MASISGASSSLGNTSIRGFGGLASGIDRDAMIEQMTLGTQTKINGQKSDITKLQWKQEAYQGISSKILDLIDNHFSYSSGKNLKDSTIFSKNRVTALGNADSTKFVTATGTSPMANYLSILGVKQLATASSMKSDVKGESPISVNITQDTLDEAKVSELQGTRLVFGNVGDKDKFIEAGTFTFPTTYTDDKGVTQTIKYSAEPDVLAEQLNEALKSSKFTLGEKGTIKFGYENGAITITGQDGAENYTLNSITSASALKALGFKSDGMTTEEVNDGISLKEFKDHTSNTKGSYITPANWFDYLKDKEVTITHGGQTKTVKLLRKEDIPEKAADFTLDKLKEAFKKNLDRAFGSGKIDVKTDSQGKLSFESSNTITITSNDTMLLENLGIDKSASNKINLDASIKDNISKLMKDASEDDRAKVWKEIDTNGLMINGVKIDVKSHTTINEMIKKINETEETGVKATYVSSTNQFVLMASETGEGRQIELDGASKDLFGGPLGSFVNGKDAEIEVSYGNGVETTITSSSNSFDLEGLKVTITGIFGYKTDANGDIKYEQKKDENNELVFEQKKDENNIPVFEQKKDENGNLIVDADGNPIKVPVYDLTKPVYDLTKPIKDSSKAVTFSTAADVDNATEAVKKFVEEYNALITEINNQVTTKPNKGYGPLTEEQKKDMTETSIENWEGQAKQGLLYNDSAMRDLSMDMQGLLAKVMQSGINYQDLEKIGITMSQDEKDGGTLTFDENKFKEAMNSNPELVSEIFTGGDSGKKGLTQIVEDTVSKYATRYSYKYGNSNGRLIDEAGSAKIPSSLNNNQISKQLKSMEEDLKKIQSRLTSERDRYISQFTSMERMINQMNSQSSYLSSLNA